MADNYLEKRMDDYRNGRLSSARRNSKLTPGGSPAGKVGFQLEVSRVFVALECRQLREAISRGYAEVGCRVAFCGSDRVEDTETAQRFGLMFCPVEGLRADEVNRMLELVAERWHGVDLIITDVPGIDRPRGAKLLIVASADGYSELRNSYSEELSSVVYEMQHDCRLSDKAVKSIVGNVLLQGCNADVEIFTKLNIQDR